MSIDAAPVPTSVRLSFAPGFGADLTSWTATIDSSGEVRQTIRHRPATGARRDEHLGRTMTRTKVESLFLLVDVSLARRAQAIEKKFAVDDTARMSVSIQQLPGGVWHEFSVGDYTDRLLEQVGLEPADLAALKAFRTMWEGLAAPLPWRPAR